MGFGGPTPPGQTPLPPAAHPPTLGSVMAAQNVAKRAAKAGGKGFSDTLKTTPQGTPTPDTAKATLLG